MTIGTETRNNKVGSNEKPPMLSAISFFHSIKLLTTIKPHLMLKSLICLFFRLFEYSYMPIPILISIIQICKLCFSLSNKGKNLLIRLPNQLSF